MVSLFFTRLPPREVTSRLEELHRESVLNGQHTHPGAAPETTAEPAPSAGGASGSAAATAATAAPLPSTSTDPRLASPPPEAAPRRVKKTATAGAPSTDLAAREALPLPGGDRGNAPQGTDAALNPPAHTLAPLGAAVAAAAGVTPAADNVEVGPPLPARQRVRRDAERQAGSGWLSMTWFCSFACRA